MLVDFTVSFVTLFLKAQYKSLAIAVKTNVFSKFFNKLDAQIMLTGAKRELAV